MQVFSDTFNAVICDYRSEVGCIPDKQVIVGYFKGRDLRLQAQ